MKSKAQYFVIGYVHNILSPEPLNSYSPVVQWSSGPVGHSEVDIDFTVYYRFTESKH